MTITTKRCGSDERRSAASKELMLIGGPANAAISKAPEME